MTPRGGYARLIKAARLGAALAFARRQGIGGDTAPVYLDIGARGGLPRAWHVAARLGVIRPVFVEPDRTEADRLAGAYPGTTVLPCALGARTERRELNLTRNRALSSLLRPDCAALSGLGCREPFAVEAVVAVDVVRLDDVWSRYSPSPPHCVKVDVQGFEQEVLIGMGKLLDDILCLEFEATFRPFYKGQPVFQEMFELLHQRGFDLVKIRPSGLFDSAILEFNALMVRRRRHGDAVVKLWKKINDVGDHQRTVAWGH